MRVPERHVAEIRERGYTVLEGFLDADELANAQVALGLHYPTAAEFAADPAAHGWLATSQWDGLVTGPWRSWDLNRLAFHPDLLDLAERFLGSADLCLYDTELWAKFASAADYEQTHHRDFGNHTLVVPRRADPPTQLIAWILLSDVTEADGPTMVVPLPATDDVPLWPDSLEGSTKEYVAHYLPTGAFADEEVAVTGPAGTLFCLRTDLVHRASRMTGAGAARFSLLANYTVWGTRWVGRTGWPTRALSPEWGELVERASPRERAVFGFPLPGDPYWDTQTLADTQARYPGADLTPYR